MDTVGVCPQLSPPPITARTIDPIRCRVESRILSSLPIRGLRNEKWLSAWIELAAAEDDDNRHRAPDKGHDLDRNHLATVNGIDPSEKSPSGTDFACQWSWYRPGGNTAAEAARTSGSLRAIFRCTILGLAGRIRCD